MTYYSFYLTGQREIPATPSVNVSTARSLPAVVAEGTDTRPAVRHKTPKTPRGKDSVDSPRFYPVMKEQKPVDNKVSRNFT